MDDGAALLFSLLLPTTFARGVLITLCYLLVGAAAVALAIVFGGLILMPAPLKSEARRKPWQADLALVGPAWRRLFIE